MATLAETIKEAVAFHQAGKLIEAEHRYKAVLAAEPDQLDALYYLGILEAQQGRHAEALASYDRLLASAPDNAAAIYNRGVILQKLARYAEALASYDRALAITPDDAEVLTNRGIALFELEQFEEALASYDQALAIKPDFVEALNNRGNVLRELNRPEEALASCDKALAIKPDYLEALTNRGVALQALNRNPEALACYDRALAIKPDYADAHWAMSMCRLAEGDFERGWQEYEWRWRTENFPSPIRNFARPQWFGQKDIKGKTILLYGEQGYGDTIQFCRYAEMVARKGARVVLEVQSTLTSLLFRLRGAEQVAGAGDKLPEFDFQCPLLSLPLAVGTRLDTIPAPIPYLAASPELTAAWETRLGATDQPRVGIVWTGSSAHKNQRNRSVPLRDLLPLAQLGVRLVSLQKELPREDLALLAAHTEVLHFGTRLENFADTAALVSLLDLVISVDTAVAHLAGAMGTPLWVMLPFVAEWRWLRDRADSPWYPTARLFRQPKAGNWDSVIADVSSALATLPRH